MVSSALGIRDHECDEGFYNLCLKPKPLQIAKRQRLRGSDSVSISRVISTSSTQQTLVPTRTSSVRSFYTQRDIPQQRHTPEFTPSTVRQASIHLDKRRRVGLVNTSTAECLRMSAAEPRGLPRNQRVTDMEDSGADHDFAPIAAGAAAKPTALRNASAGAFKKTSPLDDEDLIPGAPPPLVTQKRAVTDVLPLRAQIEATEQNQHPSQHLRTQRSFKKGFITRMMSTLTHKSQSNQAAALNQERIQRASNRQAAMSRNHGHEAARHPERNSESSDQTDSRSPITSDLDETLAVFPTPPTSTNTSPRVSGLSPGASPRARRYRNIHALQDAAIMAAELDMIAERDEVNPDDGHSMLVAVDVKGAMTSRVSVEDIWSEHTGLDVVVIIDNSLYTSPSMLMASCETTRALAAALNIVTDRLAVLCTSPINDHRTIGSDFTKIWPLSGIKVHRLKTVLDAVVNTKEKLTTSSWENAIRVATEILMRSEVPDPDSETLQDTFGLVMILTANAEGLSSDLLEHDKIQFHVVCPASVPRNTFDNIGCNGWKLRSMSGLEPQAVRLQKDRDPTSLLNRLRQVIVHARNGKDVGRLTYLSLDLKPGPDCSIESIMGDSEYLTLHPGEIRTTIVKLKFHASSERGNMLCLSTTLPSMGPDSADIVQELDRMLNIIPRPAKILTARLKYKHSLLPEGTTCSVTAECKVKKRTPKSVQGSTSEQLVLQNNSRFTNAVNQRVVYHVATNGSPKRALSAFRKEFGEDGRQSTCPDYTHLIFNELKYQARIVERLEIDASPKKSILRLTMEDMPPESEISYSSQGSLDTENRRPLSGDLDVRNEGFHRSNSIRTGVSADVGGSVRGKGRLAWDDLGNTPNAPNSPTCAKGVTIGSQQEENHKKTGKWVAFTREKRSATQPPVVSHKPSIGMFSPKRFASAGERVEKGLGGN